MLLLLVFWWDPVIATHRIVPSLLLIAFAVLGTEMLRRQVIREFPDHVTTGSPAGVAHGIAERMREARERRVATAGAPATRRAATHASPRSSGWRGSATPGRSPRRSSRRRRRGSSDLSNPAKRLRVSLGPRPG